ncbi:MAG: hypothetical protein U0K37_03865 [Acutalibacteraceae bacterium]|nr:hypothetical protein [Acutalibacteraceae bacterium]
MDSLYLFGAIMIALGAILLIVGYPVHKKAPKTGWTLMILGVAFLIASTIVIDSHFQHLKAATALIALAV